MNIRRRDAMAGIAAATLSLKAARAQAPTIRIGVLTGMSGPYRDTAGPTFVACVRQAIEDFGASARGIDVEVLTADPQNKPDIGVSIAREWFDRDDVDMVSDASNSAVALAVNTVAHQKNKVYINPGSATPDLTGAQCSPNTIKWTYDTYLVTKSTGVSTVKAGGESWFFITVDYTYGHLLQRDASRFVTEAGARVLGAVTYPFPETTDFSSYLLRAKASGAKVIAFANGGDDTANCVKQAREFALGGPDRILVALQATLNVVHALGPQAAQGLMTTESFYWDLNDRTRAFTKRVLPKTPDNYPCMVPAGGYASTLHYLKAVADLGVVPAKADGAAVVARMKAMPYDDDCFGKGVVRADGRALVPAYLFQVKTPAESSGPWDLYKLVSTLPADAAAPPLAEEGCAFVKA